MLVSYIINSFIYKRKYKIVNKKIFYYLVSLTLIILLATIISKNGFANVKAFLSLNEKLFIMFLLICFVENYSQLKYLIVSFIIGFYIVVVQVLYLSLKVPSLTHYAAPIGIMPTATIANFIFAISLYMIIQYRKKRMQVMFIFSMVISQYMMVLVNERISIISMILTLILISFFINRKVKSILISVVSIITMIVILVFPRNFIGISMHNITKNLMKPKTVSSIIVNKTIKKSRVLNHVQKSAVNVITKEETKEKSKMNRVNTQKKQGVRKRIKHEKNLDISFTQKIKKNSYFKRIMTITNDKNSSNKGRIFIWKASLTSFSKNIIFGIGRYNINKMLREYQAKYKQDKDYKGYIPSHITWWHCHNDFIEVITSLGIFGFLYWILLLVIAPIYVVRLKKTNVIKKSIFYGNLINVAVILMFVYYVAGLTDESFVNAGNIRGFWIFAMFLLLFSEKKLKEIV
jgi:ribosomal protein L14E/L6E/L27E